MSRSRKRKGESKSNPSEETVKTIEKLEKPEKPKTTFRTVGTARISKTGNALSIKLLNEGRFLHISRRDVESILVDSNHSTVANVREYDKLGEIQNGKTEG